MMPSRFATQHRLRHDDSGLRIAFNTDLLSIAALSSFTSIAEHLLMERGPGSLYYSLKRIKRWRA